MSDCTCYKLEDDLEKAETDINEARDEKERLERLLEVMIEHLWFQQDIKDYIEKQLGDEQEQLLPVIEKDIKDIREEIEKIGKEIIEWEKKLRKREDRYEKIDKKFKECVSELTAQCKKCDEWFKDKNECGSLCKGCDRWYCTRCFDESIEKAELAAGEAF